MLVERRDLSRAVTWNSTSFQLSSIAGPAAAKTSMGIPPGMKVNATVAIDPFSNLTAGDLTAVISDRGNFNRRDTNVVQWWSPNWSNFVVKVAHVVNEGRTATSNPSGLSASAIYSVKEDFSFGYAWEQHKDQFKSYTGALTNIAGGRETGHALVGHAVFGPVKVAAQLHRFKKSTGTAATVTDIKAYQVALTYSAGPHEFIYTYLKSADGLAPTAPLQPQSAMNVVGYYYRLSKRSTLVAQYLQLNNNAVGLSDAGQAITAGQDPRVLSVGMRHTF